jgi:DNA replication protein DnaC
MKKIADILKNKTVPNPTMPVEPSEMQKSTNDPQNPEKGQEQAYRRVIDAVTKGLPPRFVGIQPDNELFARIKAGESFLFTGTVGTGKTRKMLEVFTAYMVEKAMKYVWRYEDADEMPPIAESQFRKHFKTVPEVLRTLREEFEPHSKTELMDFMIKTDVLFIDDLGTENGTDWAKEQLFTVVNERYNWKRPMVISTNLNFSEIADNYGDRFASRLVEMCTKIEFSGKDWRLKK